MATSRHLFILTGASRGLGAALAAQLLGSAHNTVLTLSRHPSDALQQQVNHSDSNLVQWQADLSDAAAAGQRLSDWLGTFGPQHWASATLINNAGVVPFLAPLRDAADDDIIRGLRVNLEAPMVLTARFLRATAPWSGQRRVLNMSSGLGRHPMASQSGYCAGKAGIDLYTRCVALEEAQQPNGARVCALAPGVVDTDMQIRLRTADAEQFPDRTRFEQLKRTGTLVSATETAQRILAYLVRPDFGEQPIADIRDMAAAPQTPAA